MTQKFGPLAEEFNREEKQALTAKYHAKRREKKEENFEERLWCKSRVEA